MPLLKTRSVWWLSVVMAEMESQLGYVSGTTATHRGHHICGAVFGRKTQGECECSIVTAIIRCSRGHTHHELTKACESTQPCYLTCLQRPLKCCFAACPTRSPSEYHSSSPKLPSSTPLVLLPSQLSLHQALRGQDRLPWLLPYP